MDSREIRKKRRSSPILYTDNQPPLTRKRKSQLESLHAEERSNSTSRVDSEHNVEQQSLSTTLRKPRKKVRFSDPGPQLQNSLDGNSTGLTPALMRTSFEAPDSSNTGSIAHTPTRRTRRRSTPIPQSRRTLDPLFPYDDASPERVIQFTPLRQILDPRTRRRIQRTGLSDEMNHIAREKRECSNYQKALQTLRTERDALKQELENARQPRLRGTEQLESPSTGAISSGPEGDGNTSLANGDGDTIMINDSGIEGETMLLSDSPDIRGINECLSSIPEGLSLLSNGYSSNEASTQTNNRDKEQEDEALALSLDLEAARKEKRDLFNACRSHLPSLDGTAIGQSLRYASPPPDFLDQIIPTLKNAMDRASDATRALGCVREELSNLGFAGDNVSEIISEMRSQFRSARLGLECAVPGETANASLEDGSATLSALVGRVELLVKSLDEERKRHDGALGREVALRGQFNNQLFRYEVASGKIRSLEDAISSSAAHIYRARERMQNLEREGREQAVGIDRLNAALDKYREEVKDLEIIVTRLEEENATCKEKHQQEVAELAEKVADEEKARRDAESAVVAHEAHIRELEESLEQNRIRACDLTAHVESLEREKERAVRNSEEKTAEQLKHHEREIGSMNVRVSELSTSLEAARAEADKLRRSKTGLEEQLQLEIHARDELLDKWEADQARSFAYMKETVKADRRKSKVRAANWELRSDDIHSDNSNIGSEPITPVSMTRFVDVEVGRGKHRRRLDSGIGILSEDMLDDDDAQEINLPSDPANL
ncbi:hypothetical protein PHISCL_02097 [Aspergillus sclerotialis]|uniref:Uncharacterized protein n=1 Tax=Aspergillus sclerotialis TaxID=2070753 RepID=A0A3A2ZVX1_9EURO|nr:hypothetical protein PHISCL_02097 [Aspergillus sclerotialis]